MPAQPYAADSRWRCYSIADNRRLRAMVNVSKELRQTGGPVSLLAAETVERPLSSANAYLTERQYCDRYHISPRTAQRWRVTGQGPPWVRLGPHKIVYRLSDVERWSLARTYSHRADELSRISGLAQPKVESLKDVR